MKESLRTGEQSFTAELQSAIERLRSLGNHHESIFSEQTYSQETRPSFPARVLEVVGIKTTHFNQGSQEKHLRFGDRDIFTAEDYGLPEGEREIIITFSPGQSTPSNLLLRVIEAGKERGNPVELTESPELLQQATEEISQLADFYEVIHK